MFRFSKLRTPKPAVNESKLLSSKGRFSESASCESILFVNPFFIIFSETPIEIETATAAAAFLILCKPINGILILIIGLSPNTLMNLCLSAF